MAVYIARAITGGDEYIPTPPATASFPDVDSSSWAYKHIEYCAATYDVVKGYEDGNYHPGDPVTREQMAAYIARWRAAGDANVPAGPATPTFPDVGPGYWAYRYVEVCAANGIVQGREDGLYHPWDVVLRDAMAVFIARASEAAF